MNNFIENLDGRFYHEPLLHIAKRILDVAQSKFPKLERFVVVIRVRFVHEFAADHVSAIFQDLFPDIGAMQSRSVGAGIYFGFDFEKLQFRKIYQFPAANSSFFWTFMLQGNAGMRVE